MAIWRNTYGEWQLITESQTWNLTVPNTIQVENGKQEANNRELKAKTYKKDSLSTSLTNLCGTKLILQSKQKIRIDRSKVSGENTKAAWADTTQMY